MKCTNNGLKEFPEERNELFRDIAHLAGLCESNTGHLGDIIASIRIAMSSLNLTATKLAKKFEEQKNSN